MLEVDDSIEWDFVTLAAWWNLYGLPVLLVVVAIAVLIWSRSRPGTNVYGDSSRTVRRVGLIHCALAVQAIVFLVQELLTIRTMGIPESHIGLIIGLISSVMNPLLAIGLLYRWSFARRLAIVWYMVLSLLAILAMTWRWYYNVAFDAATWPELAVSRLMPLFLFAIMLLPRIRRVFARHVLVEPLSGEPGKPEGGSADGDRPVVWPVVSLAMLLFLIVVCSNLIVDVADCGYRMTVDAESVP